MHQLYMLFRAPTKTLSVVNYENQAFRVLSSGACAYAYFTPGWATLTRAVLGQYIHIYMYLLSIFVL